MLSIDFYKEKEELIFPLDIKDSFNKPLISYAVNYDHYLLNEFIIFDFQNDEIIYLRSYSDESKEKITNELGKKFLSALPHFILPTENGFFCFPWIYPGGDYHIFSYIDLTNGKWNFYTSEDYNLSGAGSDGSYRDGDTFYISYHDNGIERIFRSKLDLSEKELIIEREAPDRPPHEITRFRDHLILTSFNNWRQYRIKNTDEIIEGDATLDKYLQENSDAEFEPLEGVLEIVNLKDNSIDKVTTSLTPAHTLINGNELYFNCCNMSVLKNRIFYLGPGHIEKVIYKDGKFLNSGYVTHPTLFRCTSETVFNSNGETFCATIGFPNRLFLFNMTQMKLEFFHDIGETILKDNEEENKDFLIWEYGSKLENPNIHLALESSSDGKYIIFTDFDCVNFFDISERAVTYKIPYKTSEGYYGRPHHLYFLGGNHD